MTPSTIAPTATLARRLLTWLLAVVLAGAAGATVMAAPAAADPSDGTYRPRCFAAGICLSRTSGVSYTFTASTLAYDVGPTPYYISIFEVYTGERLAICSRGTECTTRGLDLTCYTMVAYVGGAGMSMPPQPVQRTSATVEHCFGAG